MRFLIDADMPRVTADVLLRHGHEAVDVRDVGLGGSKDAEIASFARQHGLCLLTADLDFADIRAYPPDQNHGLVVLRLPSAATSEYISQLVEGFLQRTDLVTGMRGKLAIVEPGRVRLRSG